MVDSRVESEPDDYQRTKGPAHVLASFAAALALFGCDPTRATPLPTTPGNEPPPCDLAYSYYRVSSVELGDTLGANAENEKLGVPLAGDYRDTIANVLGPLREIASCGSLVAPSTLSVFLDTHTWILAFGSCPGQQRASFLRGHEVSLGLFALDEASPTPAVGLGGELAHGRGSVPLTAFFSTESDPESVTWVEVLGLAVVFESSSPGTLESGSMSFGIHENLWLDVGIPAFTALATATFELTAQQPELGCSVQYADLNSDGIISADELGPENSLIYNAFYPDLDLLANFEGPMGSVELYSPETDPDQWREHISMGMRFSLEEIQMLP